MSLWAWARLSCRRHTERPRTTQWWQIGQAAAAPVILSYPAWARLFVIDENVIGENANQWLPRTIIGVLPDGFIGPMGEVVSTSLSIEDRRGAPDCRTPLECARTGLAVETG